MRTREFDSRQDNFLYSGSVALSDRRGQDGNVAIGGIGNLARQGPSAVNEIQTNKQTTSITILRRERGQGI